MKTRSIKTNPSFLKEALAFVIHLRIHYQVFILSGPFFLGSVFGNTTLSYPYWLQYFNVHVLLFGGVTAFNSYYDKDEGPVGGLKKPPPMKGWMLPASWGLQLSGLLWAFYTDPLMGILFFSSMLMFLLYSHPSSRWKGKPLLSFIAIGFSTGFFPFFIGFIASGGKVLPESALFQFSLIPAAFGITLLLVSLYPISQIYQMEEDKKRGDVTFAIRFGMKGIKRSFLILFSSGLLFTSFALLRIKYIAEWALVFFFLALTAGIYLWIKISGLQERNFEYNQVMNLKYLSSFLLVLFLFFLNFYR